MYKVQNVMSPEDIAKNCEEIKKFCEDTYDADNAHVVVQRAQILEGYLSFSGKMVADAKWHHSNLLNSIIMDAIKEANAIRMATTTLNKYIDSICKDYQYLVDWSDRINRTVTHQLDFARSMVSKHKTEFQANQLNNYGQRA